MQKYLYKGVEREFLQLPPPVQGKVIDQLTPAQIEALVLDHWELWRGESSDKMGKLFREALSLYHQWGILCGPKLRSLLLNHTDEIKAELKAMLL